MIINNVKYLTLSEYCEAVNAERSKKNLTPVSEGAVRTKVARHQIPAEVIGHRWMVVWVLRGLKKPFANRFTYPNHNKQERTS